MNNTNLIISIITGILTILGTVVIVCIGWGKMKQFMEDLEKSLCEFKKDIKDELRIIREDLKSHDKDIAFLKGRKYADSDSPLKLNASGLKVLKESGVDKIIEDHKIELLQKIYERKPTTFYDVQELSKNVLEEFKNNADVVLKLKDGAYKSGVDIDIVLYVGALYLRDFYIDEKFDKK